MAATRDILMQDGALRDLGVVRAIRTRPGKMVFTADGTPDAWVASDLCVPLQP